MTKTQIYLPEAELVELHQIAKKSRRSLADLIREAIRKTWLSKSSGGPIALWKGPSGRTSVDHDSIYDKP